MMEHMTLKILEQALTPSMQTVTAYLQDAEICEM